MYAPSPLIDISTGVARFIAELPRFESGHNYTNEIGNIDAEDDWHALLCFLNEYRYSEKTFRSYAAELERLCLWLIHVRQLPLSALKRADLAAYYDFVVSPPSSWCGNSAQKMRRDGSINPAWRPFKLSAEGQAGLASSSVHRLQKILQSMFTYLVDEGYLLGNPATARRTMGQRAAKTAKSTERFLQPHEALFAEKILVDACGRALEHGGPGAYFKALRRCYIYQLFLHTGLRISEPVKYSMGDIRIRGTGESKTVSLDVCGKGNLEGESRTVVFGKSFVEILKVYRLALNQALSHSQWTPLDPLPAVEEPTPLIPDVSGLRPIGERQISTIFVEIRELCIEAIDALLLRSGHEQERINDLLRMRSTFEIFTCHWMRHTHATFFLALTGDLKATQDRLGHADLATTQIYVHMLDKTRAETADKFNPALMSEVG